jgi:transcription elongation GreA/GreB family factor
VKEKIILSTVSAWALGDRFESTQAQKNDALREAKVAKQDGDLSENAPYQAAKEKFRTMGRIQRRLTREMDQLLTEGHRLVDPLTWVNDSVPEVVELGTVVVIDLDGEREKFLVAGARDHHITCVARQTGKSQFKRDHSGNGAQRAHPHHSPSDPRRDSGDFPGLEGRVRRRSAHQIHGSIAAQRWWGEAPEQPLVHAE